MIRFNDRDRKVTTVHEEEEEESEGKFEAPAPIYKAGHDRIHAPDGTML